MATILVVEDEAPVQAVLCRGLTAAGHSAVGVASGEDAIRSARAHPPHLALLDLKLPGIDGLETFRALLTEHPNLKGVVLTGFGTIPNAVSAIRSGIFEYLEKPVDLDRLRTVIADCLGPVRDVDTAAEQGEFEGMIGSSPAMKEVFRLIPRVAASTHPVLIEGETGTGKELVARAIHRHSPNRNGPFVDINCAAGQVTLFESEFFGHERGAFTDAREAKPGRFEQAHGGTLFLDEVGELPLEAQAKLLRVVERGEATRVGGTRVIRFDVRLIAATNVDLEQAVQHGRFRRDLYYRLNAVTVRLPPVRDRPGDLPLLVDRLFERIRREQRERDASLSPEARAIMLAYTWPGNVRELEHALLTSLVAAVGTRIESDDLPKHLHRPSPTVVPADWVLAEGSTLSEHVGHVSGRVERSLIQKALARTGGNRQQAARLLGIDRRTLLSKLVRLGLIQRRPR